MKVLAKNLAHIGVAATLLSGAAVSAMNNSNNGNNVLQTIESKPLNMPTTLAWLGIFGLSRKNEKKLKEQQAEEERLERLRKKDEWFKNNQDKINQLNMCFDLIKCNKTEYALQIIKDITDFYLKSDSDMIVPDFRQSLLKTNTILSLDHGVEVKEDEWSIYEDNLHYNPNEKGTAIQPLISHPDAVEEILRELLSGLKLNFKISYHNPFSKIYSEYEMYTKLDKFITSMDKTGVGNAGTLKMTDSIKSSQKKAEFSVKTEPINKIHKNVQKNNSKIMFDDIGGQDEAISQIKKRILYPIKYPSAYKNSNVSHGIILYGPPGTGKSLLGEALANEADANFYKINASELDSKYIGESEENWRNLVNKAIKSQPSIIFMDEFDAIAKRRGSHDVHGDKVLNQILALISDIEKKGYKVFFIGATNNFESLDPAITRSGRLDTHIKITAPKETSDVLDIFNIHIKGKPCSENINFADMAERLLSCQATGADIALFVNNAYENAMCRNGIYEKMENNQYSDSDINNVIIEQIDIDEAFKLMN